MRVLHLQAPAETAATAETEAAAEALAPPAMAWRVLEDADGATEVRAHGDSLEDAARYVADVGVDRVVLVVPGEHVLLTGVRVPARQRRQLERALPYVVEEHLAEDVEGLHLAAGARGADGRVPVAVIRPGDLGRWLETARAAGLDPDRARVDAGALAAPPDAGATVLVGPRRALVRTGPHEGFAVERGSLSALLAAWCASRPEDEALAIQLQVASDVDGGERALDLAPLDSELGRLRRVDLQRERLALPFEEAVARGLHPGDRGLELLQKRFAPQERGVSAWRRWRGVAALLLVWIVTQGGLDLARASWLSREADALEARSEAEFRELFPQRTRIVDPRAELEALLQGGGGTGERGFLALLGDLATAVRAADSADITLRSLSYSRPRGELALELDADALDTVDRLQAALRERGLNAEIGSATQEASGVRARLQLRPPGGGA